MPPIPDPMAGGRQARAGALALVVLACLPLVGALRLDKPSADNGEPSIVLVQGTNRPVPYIRSLRADDLFEQDSPPGVLSDWLGALQTADYAKRHNYGYRMYRYNESYKGACWHPVRGPLLAQWCKIQAIRMGFEDHPKAELVVWVDTDVHVRHLRWPLESFLEKVPLLKYENVTDPKSCPKEEPLGGRGHIKVWAARNSHWPHWEGLCGPNSGFIAFRRSEFTTALLEGWWEIAMQQGYPGPYDQGYIMLKYRESPQELVVFEQDHFSNIPWNYLLHRCQKCKWLPNRTDLFLDSRPRGMTVADVNDALQHLQQQVDTKIRDQTPHSG